jgi:hypothetical protein
VRNSASRSGDNLNREAIEVGASTWSRIQRLYEPDATAHRERCESEGLQCPQEVFTQLFHEQSNNEDFAVIVRSIDYYSAFGLAFQAAPGYARGVQREAALVGASRLTLRYRSEPPYGVPFGAFASAALSWGRLKIWRESRQ